MQWTRTIQILLRNNKFGGLPVFKFYYKGIIIKTVLSAFRRIEQNRSSRNWPHIYDEFIFNKDVH